MEPLALRYNSGKPRFELVPPQWILWLAQILTEGAKKYAANNWQLSINTEDHEAFIQDRVGSLYRHINAWQSGVMLDPETHLPHLVHAAWNALTIATYDQHKRGNHV